MLLPRNPLSFIQTPKAVPTAYPPARPSSPFKMIIVISIILVCGNQTLSYMVWEVYYLTSFVEPDS